jgi:Coenzyme PQQ synthesis protein D (PqqD)
MELSDEARVSPAAGVSVQPLEDRAVLVNLQTGRCFELNRIGAEIWRLLAEGKSVGGACDALAARYPTARDILRDDVMGLIRSLLREKLAEIVSL